ncbi:MAG: glycosyltransferase family 1 protein [Bacteroidota bacterium]
MYDFTYEKYGKFPHKWIHGLQKKHAIKKADAIICISESTKMDLLYYFPEIPEERLFVTHLAASDCFFSFGTQSSSRFDEPYVLFVGARGGYKNFKSVVYALSAVPSVKLLFVGGGPITTEEGDLLNKLLSNRFQHMGSISSEQLNKLYNDALCLIYPSQYEGFGIPILEAMAADCPVIAANCSSIPEVANNCAVLLDTPDPEAIANAVKTMMDKDVNDRYVALGRENAKGFTWDKTVEKTIEIYSSL